MVPYAADSPFKAISILYRKSHIWLNNGCAQYDLTAAQAVVIMIVCDFKVLTQDEITVTLDGEELRYGVDYIVSYENNTAEGTATAIVTGLGQYGYSGSASAEFEIKAAEPAEPVLEEIAVKEPCRTNYTEGETLDPAGLVLELKYSDGSTAAAAYTEETAADFTFTPALDQQLTTSDTEVTVEYAGKAAVFNINVQPAMVTITSVEVAAGPDKTEYTEGETLDPTGLVLRVIYSDGSDGTIGYNAETADWFDFTPDLGTALTTDIKEVAVTYQNHTVTFAVSVNGKDPGTDPEPEQRGQRYINVPLLRRHKRNL